jgi:hypothetical protein
MERPVALSGRRVLTRRPHALSMAKRPAFAPAHRSAVISRKNLQSAASAGSPLHALARRFAYPTDPWAIPFTALAFAQQQPSVNAAAHDCFARLDAAKLTIQSATLRSSRSALTHFARRSRLVPNRSRPCHRTARLLLRQGPRQRPSWASAVCRRRTSRRRRSRQSPAFCSAIWKQRFGNPVRGSGPRPAGRYRVAHRGCPGARRTLR